MAIIKEYYRTREDGVILERTYSDKGVMIERDGKRYDEAIDPREYNRDYEETNEPIEVFEEAGEMEVTVDAES